MPSTWTRLAEHARDHHGTIAWADARALGVPPSSLAGWCRQGRLERPAPGLYVVAGGPPSWHRTVAVAAASTGGWASHRTAAALWRLDGFRPGPVEVLTPYARRRARSAWTVHESRRLRGVDLDRTDGIPVTSLVRTLLDLPAVAHPFRVAQALDDACRRRAGLLDDVAARFLELAGRGRTGTRAMRDLLDERVGRGAFAQSGFEARTVRLVRAMGLPPPVLQHRVTDGDRFVVHLDLAWPAVRWAVECDSLAHHSGKQAHEWDRRRRRTLKRLGWDVVEVTYDDVTRRPDRTGTDLRSLHAARARAVGHSDSRAG